MFKIKSIKIILSLIICANVIFLLIHGLDNYKKAIKINNNNNSYNINNYYNKQNYFSNKIDILDSKIKKTNNSSEIKHYLKLKNHYNNEYFNYANKLIYLPSRTSDLNLKDKLGIFFTNILKP